MRVIFLDIDGVLNSRDFFHRRHRSIYKRYRDADGRFDIDPRAVALLNELVRKTNAYLVLSSTWRLGFRGLEKTKSALAVNGFDFSHRFLGITPQLSGDDGETGRRLERGDEICAWLDDWHSFYTHEYKIESFVVLDDDSDMYGVEDRLVQTSWMTGLTSWKCEEAERLLLE